MKKDNSFLTKYAASFNHGTHRFIAEKGFEPLGRFDEPYIGIEGIPVYVRGHSTFDEFLEWNFIEEWDVKKLYRFGEYYDYSLIAGMPPIGGSIKIYVDSRSQKGWYLLWAVTRLDSFYVPNSLDRRIVAWTPRIKGDTYLKAGFRLTTGWVYNNELDEDDDGQMTNTIYYWHYRIIDENRIDTSCIFDPHFTYYDITDNLIAVFTSARCTVFDSEDELEKVISNAPDFLKEDIRKNARIGYPKEVKEWAKKNNNRRYL